MQKGCILTDLGITIWRESRVALATAIQTELTRPIILWLIFSWEVLNALLRLPFRISHNLQHKKYSSRY